MKVKAETKYLAGLQIIFRNYQVERDIYERSFLRTRGTFQRIMRRPIEVSELSGGTLGHVEEIFVIHLRI